MLLKVILAAMKQSKAVTKKAHNKIILRLEGFESIDTV